MALMPAHNAGNDLNHRVCEGPGHADPPSFERNRQRTNQELDESHLPAFGGVAEANKTDATTAPTAAPASWAR
jgi:hypothetical protein